MTVHDQNMSADILEKMSHHYLQAKNEDPAEWQRTAALNAMASEMFPL